MLDCQANWLNVSQLGYALVSHDRHIFFVYEVDSSSAILSLYVILVNKEFYHRRETFSKLRSLLTTVTKTVSSQFIENMYSPSSHVS